MKKNIKWLFLASISLVACSDDDVTVVEVPVSAGTANFSKYIALGDSFAAGFSDNALFINGQDNSYPSILALQFANAGGGDFSVPYMTDNIGGFSSGGTQIAMFGPRLYLNGQTPTPVSGVSGTDISTKLTGSYSNLGIPGAKSFHLVTPGYGSAAGNPYFARFASAASTTVLADALSQTPTFFSLWIGGNDVLGYATSGGDGSNPITPLATFDAAYNDLTTQLSSGGKKGVVANLPYINSLPYFTTVPFNPLTSKVLGAGNVAVGDATIGQLNSLLYGPLKQALTAFGAGERINLLSTTSGNPLLIKDESLSNLSAQLTAAFTPSLGAATAAFYGSVFGQARQANNTDLVLLPTQSVIGTAPVGVPSPLNKFGITYPLQDKHVLVPTEVAEIKAATDSYNITIKAAADTHNLAFVDTKAVMDRLVSGGIVSNGYTMTSTYVTGNSFSLDGVHPGARGYALIANQFILAINAKYGSTFKGANLGDYQILYPASF
ncbi:G-D-S-L family lipolytic protein [Flavobacterium sp.]|uniref:G-D-S-L family lipolytic protein n=1 Tax=Flavobacterium sp. TaxID=239 RepID=UPI00286E450D|nr:G-D-S-L family lipolytic protein [Flavobacterium sp.]